MLLLRLCAIITPSNSNVINFPPATRQRDKRGRGSSRSADLIRPLVVKMQTRKYFFKACKMIFSSI